MCWLGRGSLPVSSHVVGKQERSQVRGCLDKLSCRSFCMGCFAPARSYVAHPLNSAHLTAQMLVKTGAWAQTVKWSMVLKRKQINFFK